MANKLQSQYRYRPKTRTNKYLRYFEPLCPFHLSQSEPAFLFLLLLLGQQNRACTAPSWVFAIVQERGSMWCRYWRCGALNVIALLIDLSKGGSAHRFYKASLGGIYVVFAIESLVGFYWNTRVGYVQALLLQPIEISFNLWNGLQMWKGGTRRTTLLFDVQLVEFVAPRIRPQRWHPQKLSLSSYSISYSAGQIVVTKVRLVCIHTAKSANRSNLIDL